MRFMQNGIRNGILIMISNGRLKRLSGWQNNQIILKKKKEKRKLEKENEKKKRNNLQK